MSDRIKFTLDGREVTAEPGESIWEVAKREGTLIPHLCHKDAPGYRSDGNCRACMVEIEGERTLAASCIREPSDGMVVNSAGDRPTRARKMVMEMLVADQPAQEEARDQASHLWQMAGLQGVRTSRLPKLEAERVPLLDDSHVAMRVNLDSCIHCNLCVRACREVQVNDVIGFAGRGHDAKIVFDMDDPMGASTCVACGECVQACPTGALMPATALDDKQHGNSQDYDREVESVCPYCGVGCQLSRSRSKKRTASTRSPGSMASTVPANEKPALRQGPLRVRLCRAPAPPDQADDPPRGCSGQGAERRSLEPVDAFPRGDVGRGAGRLPPAWLSRSCARTIMAANRVAGFGSAKCSNEEAYLFQKLIRQGFKPQQCRPLHAALPRLVGCSTAGECRFGCGDRDLQRDRECRRRHRHRCEPDREPPGRGHLFQAVRQARRQADRHGSARSGPEAPRDAHAAVPPRRGRRRC